MRKSLSADLPKNGKYRKKLMCRLFSALRVVVAAATRRTSFSRVHGEPYNLDLKPQMHWSRSSPQVVCDVLSLSTDAREGPGWITYRFKKPTGKTFVEGKSS